MDQELELDGGSGQEPAAPSTPVPHFELDVDSAAEPSFRQAPAEATPASPAQRASAPQAPPSPADDVQTAIRAAQERATAAERRADMALSAITPYLSALQQQAAGGQPRRVSMEEMLRDPNVTIEQVLSFVKQEIAQGQTQAQQVMELTARRTASEAHWRGQFTGEGFQGRDYDTMRGKHLAPLFERIPYLRDVCVALNPEQPALIEYGLATLMELSQRAGDNPVKFYRGLWAMLDGQVDDQGQKIQQAARAQATRVAAAHTTGRQRPAQATRVNGAEIWDLSDRAFDELDRQVTGGV